MIKETVGASVACTRPCKPLRKHPRRISACAVGRMYAASSLYVDERDVACSVSRVGQWGKDINGIMESLDEVKGHFADESVDDLRALFRSTSSVIVIREVIQTLREAIRSFRNFQRRHRFLRFIVRKLLLVNVLISIVESLLGLADLFAAVEKLVDGYTEYNKNWSCETVNKCKGERI